MKDSHVTRVKSRWQMHDLRGKHFSFWLKHGLIIVLALSSLQPRTGLGQSSLGDFMNAVTGNDQKLQEVYVAYWNGVMDATMNIGTHLGMWCFPTPMPTRKRLLQEYLVDAGALALEIGEDEALSAEIDQALWNFWGKRYLCPDAPKLKGSE